MLCLELFLSSLDKFATMFHVLMKLRYNLLKFPAFDALAVDLRCAK